MPEAGLIPIPKKLAMASVKDTLRLSNGRRSGTAGGTIMLHISPEAVVPSKGEFMTRPRATQGSHEIDVSHGSQKRPARSESIIETSPASLGELKEGIEVGDFLKLIFLAIAKPVLE
jgi:hypothetical protein